MKKIAKFITALTSIEDKMMILDELKKAGIPYEFDKHVEKGKIRIHGLDPLSFSIGSGNIYMKMNENFDVRTNFRQFFQALKSFAQAANNSY